MQIIDTSTGEVLFVLMKGYKIVSLTSQNDEMQPKTKVEYEPEEGGKRPPQSVLIPLSINDIKKQLDHF